MYKLYRTRPDQPSEFILELRDRDALKSMAELHAGDDFIRFRPLWFNRGDVTELCIPGGCCYVIHLTT